MATGPRMRMRCSVSAGTQTARSGGTTQVPCAVATTMTPTEA